MRPFYIIGHNPNTVTDAVNYLRAGANALEPDVHLTNGQYYIGEGTTSTDLSLVNYLNGLCTAFTTDPTLVPALIMFDTKSSDGNILDLQKCIQTNFSNRFKDTAISITRSQAQGPEHTFFAPVAGSLLANEGVGIDEHTQPEYVDAFFKSLGVSAYTYADGISIQLPLLADFFKPRIKQAIAMRDTGSSFKMVYAWTLDLHNEIEGFLELNPDGLITDHPAWLKQTIVDKFSAEYTLAKPGDNPFK